MLRRARFMTGLVREGRPLGLLAALALVLHMAMAGFAHAATGPQGGDVICTLAGAEKSAPAATPHDALCAALCQVAGSAAVPLAQGIQPLQEPAGREAVPAAAAAGPPAFAHALARAPPVRSV